MALSIRTLVREQMWTKLIRSLPEGQTFIGILTTKQSDALRATLRREHTLQNEKFYSIRSENVYSKGRGKVVINVSRRAE